MTTAGPILMKASNNLPMVGHNPIFIPLKAQGGLSG